MIKVGNDMAWEPIEEYKTGHKYGGMSLDNGVVTIWDEDCEVTKSLPDDIRLCRQVAAPAPGVQIPKEVAETIEIALGMARYQNYKNKAEMRPKIDAALAWLEEIRNENS